ncbi:MAG: MBOAT family protein [Boseongicola sp.]|nr:MBOAT family protein [Boseongicola sp.]
MSFLTVNWIIWICFTIGVYWSAPRAARPWVLMGLSISFMLVNDPLSAGLLVGAWVVTAIGITIPRLTSVSLGLAIGILVLALAGFKISSIAATDTFMQDVGIPLGLSYYTFRCLHVLIERYKGTLGEVSLRDLSSYLFFIPTFVIGPIHRINTFLRDQKRQHFNLKICLEGGERIVLGYFKIVVLSNFLIEFMFGQVIENISVGNPGLAAYLTIVQDGLNIYLQFSGHSDVAIGFAAAIGFRVIENFDRPYLQPNISAFWRSWHISLSQWCREYVYGPIVARTRSPALGALTTMLIIGLWHEISLRYLLWGAFHALGIIIWQKYQGFSANYSTQNTVISGQLAHILSVIITVHFVWFSFIILTTPELSQIPERFLLGGSN